MDLHRGADPSAPAPTHDTDEIPAVATPRPAEPAGEPRHRRRLWSFVVLTAVVVLAAGAFSAWWFLIRNDSTSRAATGTRQVVEVTSGTIGVSVSAKGTVEAAATEDLAFASAGTVTAVRVSAGDTVTPGQVLATIDSAKLEAAVAKAEAAVAEAEAKLDADTDAGASSKQLSADRSSLTAAQDALHAARKALDGASLVATIAGTVTTVDLVVGDELGDSGTSGTTPTGSASGSGQSSSTLGSSTGTGMQGARAAQTPSTSASSTSISAQIQVVSTSSFSVQLAVDSSDIASVVAGQSVQLDISTSTSSSTGGGFPGMPGGGGLPGMPGGASGPPGQQRSQATANATDATATGTVAEVGRVADASSGVATYPVTVTFSADASKVFVGSTATAEIDVSQRSGVTQVSARAVTSTQGRSVVTVALEGTAEGRTAERTVTTGETTNGMVEIVAGLEPGDKVIVNMPSFPGGGGMPPSGLTPPGMPGGG